MENTPKYSASLSKTLKESNLTDVSVDIAETILDSTLKDGILRDIPILGSLVGFRKTIVKVQDVLFLKKIIYFINEVKDISPNEREEIISKIDNSAEYRVKIGEKLLYILDKADDHEKTQLIGKLFRALLTQNISYDDFLKGSSVIDRSFITDLNWFLKHDWEKLSIEEAGEYINWGLFEIAPLTIKLKEKRHEPYDEWEQKTNFKLEGADLSVTITDVAKILRKYLK